MDRPELMSQPNTTIEEVPSSRRAQVLRYLLRSEEPFATESSFEHLQFAGTDNETMLWARRDQEMLGACWARVVPGRVINVLPPDCLPGTPASVARKLAEGLSQFLQVSHGACLAQAAVAAGRPGIDPLLRGIGFRPVTEVVMMWSEGTPQATGRLRSEVCMDVHQANQLRDMLVAADPQRDARPEWDLRRTAVDDVALLSHSSGNQDSSWIALRQQDELVGCAVVARNSTHAFAEILYLWLCPELRGTGLAADAIRSLQSLLYQEDLALVSFVDRRQQSAWRAFASVGFHTVWRRHLYCRSLA